MVKSFFEYYYEIYEMNLRLLEMARQERWDEVLSLAETYVICMHDAPVRTPEEFTDEEKEELTLLLKNIVNNEEEITHKLKSRLDSLTEDMSSLQQSKKQSSLYALQQTSLFH